MQTGFHRRGILPPVTYKQKKAEPNDPAFDEDLYWSTLWTSSVVLTGRPDRSRAARRRRAIRPGGRQRPFATVQRRWGIRVPWRLSCPCLYLFDTVNFVNTRKLTPAPVRVDVICPGSGKVLGPSSQSPARQHAGTPRPCPRWPGSVRPGWHTAPSIPGSPSWLIK